jgi:SAM-dependent methyltransferase
MVELSGEDVALVAAPGAAHELPLRGSPRRLRPGRLTPLSAPFRTARLGIVADPAAMPAAAVAQRLYRVPWVALVDGEGAYTAGSSLARAGAVLASPDAVDAVRAVVPGARIVDRSDFERVAAVLADIALPPEARVGDAGALGPAVAGAWTFVDDRATRLAIRLVPVTGKARHPTHPKHLIEAPWHRWYLDAIEAGDRAIDVGCHDGHHTLLVAERAAYALGVDVDARALERARARAAAERADNVEFAVADLSDPGSLERFGAESFDVALLLDALEHLVERVGVLAAIHSLLREGGRLVVAVPRAETSYKRRRRRLGAQANSDPDHKVEYTHASITAELEEAGFAVERLERGGGFDTPFAGVSTLVAPLSLRAFAWISRRRQRLLAERPDEATAFRIVATKHAA